MNLCEHKPALLPIQCTFGACGAPVNKFMMDSDGFRVDLFRQVGPLFKRLQVVFLINFIGLSIEQIVSASRVVHRRVLLFATVFLVDRFSHYLALHYQCNIMCDFSAPTFSLRVDMVHGNILKSQYKPFWRMPFFFVFFVLFDVIHILEFGVSSFFRDLQVHPFS